MSQTLTYRIGTDIVRVTTKCVCLCKLVFLSSSDIHTYTAKV